jgi:hypothetical protein
VALQKFFDKNLACKIASAVSNLLTRQAGKRRASESKPPSSMCELPSKRSVGMQCKKLVVTGHFKTSHLWAVQNQPL